MRYCYIALASLECITVPAGVTGSHHQLFFGCASVCSVCVWIYVCMNACVCFHVEPRGWHRISSSIAVHLSFETVSEWTWNWPIPLDWLARDPACLHLPRPGIWMCVVAPRLLHSAVGDWTRVFMLVQQVLYWLNLHTSLLNCSF